MIPGIAIRYTPRYYNPVTYPSDPIEKEEEPMNEVACPFCGKVWRRDPASSDQYHDAWFAADGLSMYYGLPVNDYHCIQDVISDWDTPESREEYLWDWYRQSAYMIHNEDDIYRTAVMDFLHGEDSIHAPTSYVFTGSSADCDGIGKAMIDIIKKQYPEQWQEFVNYTADDDQRHEYEQWLWRKYK